LPAGIRAAHPKRGPRGEQVMLRSVEVDGPEFPCCRRADAEVAARKLAGEPIHVGFAQFDLELQFLHEPSPNNAFPLPAREDRCDKRMTGCFSSPGRSVTCNYAFHAQFIGSECGSARPCSIAPRPCRVVVSDPGRPGSKAKGLSRYRGSVQVRKLTRSV